MLTDGWDALGCPYCRSALNRTDDELLPLRCQSCGEQFAVENRVPVLLRRQDIARLAEFSRSYREARLREGHQPLSPEQAQALPYGHPSGYPGLYWEVRRQTFSALMSLLAREGPSPAHGPAADLGAGNGWLSYRLAQIGHRVLAVEAGLDPVFGLGAAKSHYASLVSLQPVQGNLEHPPLQAGKLGLIVCNASLHYASDLGAAIRRMADALKPGGRLAILDSPIASQPRPGTGQGDRHLGRQELHNALLEAGLSPRWVPVQRGSRWWVHQAKALLWRHDRFWFPMIVAERPR